MSTRDDNEDFHQDFDEAIDAGFFLMKKVASGAFGRVHRAEHTRTRSWVAIKTIKTDKYRNCSELIHKEINCLKAVSPHPNIAEFFHTYGSSGPVPTHLVMELLPTDLSRHLAAVKRLAEDEARVILGDVLCGLQHCHNLGIGHRDIKPGNIMLTFERRAKLIDFGVAAYCPDDKGQLEQQTSCSGTRTYMAPEVLQRKTYSATKADVWSAGIVLYEITVGPNSYTGPDKENHLSPPLRSLIQQMVNPLPKDRCTVTDALQHPWMTGYVPVQPPVFKYITRRRVVAKLLRLYPELPRGKALKETLDGYNAYSTAYKLMLSELENDHSALVKQHDDKAEHVETEISALTSQAPLVRPALNDGDLPGGILSCFCAPFCAKFWRR